MWLFPIWAGSVGTCAALARSAVPFPLVVAAAVLLNGLAVPLVLEGSNGHHGGSGSAANPERRPWD